MAGTASWLVYVAATIALLIVGLNVSKLANRIPAAGSFFIYVSRALGPSYGLLTGWSLLAAYLFTAMALTLATSIFIKTLITTLQVSVTPSTIAIYLIVSALVLCFAFRDIRLSSRVGLTLEAISVVIILAVSIAALAHFDFKADVKQFTLEGADVGKSLEAIVFAIFSFVGFESAASLGKEARNPERVIPKAILWTAISAGVFFVFTTYVITQGFADDATKLGASGAPLGDTLAGQNPLIIALVYFGAAISSFACALASINAFGRTPDCVTTAVGRSRKGGIKDPNALPLANSRTNPSRTSTVALCTPTARNLASLLDHACRPIGAPRAAPHSEG
jgi:amino acid transporter